MQAEPSTTELYPEKLAIRTQCFTNLPMPHNPKDNLAHKQTKELKVAKVLWGHVFCWDIFCEYYRIHIAHLIFMTLLGQHHHFVWKKMAVRIKWLLQQLTRTCGRLQMSTLECLLP